MGYYDKKTTTFKRIVFSRGMAFVIVIAIVFMAFSLFSIIGKSTTAARARKIAESEARELSVKQADLSKKLSMLSTKEGQEAALREQFPVVSQGEHVVVIVDSNDHLTVSTASAASQGGFWNFLKNLFKKD